MKRFRFLRRQDPVASLSWHFEDVSADGPMSSLSWHFEEAVRGSAPMDIAPSVAAVHIGAAAQAARVAPVPTPAQPEAAVSSLRAAVRKRRLVLGGLMSSVTAKVLLGTMTALAATGGAAAANVLPDPVQAVVADAAAVVGIDLPSPDAESAAVVVTDEDDPLDGSHDKPLAEDPQDDGADHEPDDDVADDDDTEGPDDESDDADDDADDESDGAEADDADDADNESDDDAQGDDDDDQGDDDDDQGDDDDDQGDDD